MCLKQKGKLSAKELSEYLEVSMRTIYRDMDALSQMNVPIIAYEGTSGGYEIDESYYMPAIRLSEKEVLILMLLLKVSDKLSLPDFRESINALELKLKNACGDTADRYKRILRYITMDVQDISPENYLVGAFGTILKAFDESVKLRIKYYSPLKNRISERDITPFHLFYNEGVWYLDAYCHSRCRKRTFRLDRIKDISLLAEKTSSELEKQYMSESLSDPKLSLEFEIYKDLFNLIKYDNAMIGAQIISETDLSYIVSIETKRLAYFENLAFRNAEDVTILSPETFLKQLGEKLTSAAKKYL